MKPVFKVLSFDLDNALYDNQPVITHAEQCSSDYLHAEFEKQGKSFKLSFDCNDDLLAFRKSVHQNGGKVMSEGFAKHFGTIL